MKSGKTVRTAFSLAELMIALAILGFGLLIIGAALPVGLNYTRASIDMATGEAAIDYAFSVLNAGVRPSLTVERDHFFRPRARKDRSRDDAPLDERYEPHVKVWPLMARGINAAAGPDFGTQSKIADNGFGESDDMIHLERLIDAWLSFSSNSYQRNDKMRENVASKWMWPALPSITPVYPPILPNTFNEFTPSYFLSDLQSKPYERRVVYPDPSDRRKLNVGAETRKAMDRRVVWTTLYRQARQPEGSSARVFEMLVIASRLPGPNFRFPLQDPGLTFGGSRLYSRPVSTHAPVPWLVVFDSFDVLREGEDYDEFGPTKDRILRAEFKDPGTWKFTCRADDAGLFRAGSIFIPAVNDDLLGYDNAPRARKAGFVPHSPDALPVYEVVERPDAQTVVVKTNGFYPWLAEGESATQWPVWVIPPAVESEVRDAPPAFDKRSPILSVGRRFLQFREIE